MCEREEVVAGSGVYFAVVAAEDGDGAPSYTLHNDLVNRVVHATVAVPDKAAVKVELAPKQTVDIEADGATVTKADVEFTDELVVQEDPGERYTDEAFGDDSHLPGGEDGEAVKWVRAQQIPRRTEPAAPELSQPGEFSAGGILPGAAAAEHWFADALHVVAAAPLAMQRVLPASSSQATATGEIDVRLNLSGMWTVVTVDDRLPYNTTRQCIQGVSNVDLHPDRPGSGYYWAAFVYKAVAKVCGGYREVEAMFRPGTSRGVKMLAAVRMLTGGVGGEVGDLAAVVASDARLQATMKDMQSWLADNVFITACTHAEPASASPPAPADTALSVTKVLPVREEGAAGGDDEPKGEQWLVRVEGRAGVWEGEAAAAYVAHYAAVLPQKKKDTWSAEAQAAADEEVQGGLWLTADAFCAGFAAVAWTTGNATEELPGSDVRVKSSFDLSEVNLSTGLLVWADVGARLTIGIHTDAPPGGDDAVGVFVIYPRVQGGIRFFQSEVVQGAPLATLLVGIDDIAAGRPAVVVPYSAASGCRDYCLTVTAARRQTIKRYTPFYVTAAHLHVMLLEATLREEGSEVAEGLTVHKWARGAHLAVAYRNDTVAQRYSVTLGFEEQDGADGTSLRQLHPAVKLADAQALKVDACAHPGGSALVARVARVPEDPNAPAAGPLAAPTDFQLSFSALAEGEAAADNGAPETVYGEDGGEGVFDEANCKAATKLCTLQVDGETYTAPAQTAVATKPEAEPPTSPPEDSPASTSTPPPKTPPSPLPDAEETAKKPPPKSADKKAPPSPATPESTDDNETATTRALKRLEADAAAMRNETPPQALAYRTIASEPTPQRAAPLRSVQNRAHTPSPGLGSSGNGSVFERLYGAAHPKPQTAPVVKPRKLTQIEQLKSVDRMFKDAIDKRRNELKKLETRIYGDCSLRHVLSLEDMQGFTDKLYNQGCAAKVEKKKRLEEQYLKELVPVKRVDLAHQNAVTKKLYDTIEHDRDLSASLDNKHNKQRTRTVRNEADWAATVERLCSKG